MCDAQIMEKHIMKVYQQMRESEAAADTIWEWVEAYVWNGKRRHVLYI